MFCVSIVSNLTSQQSILWRNVSWSTDQQKKHLYEISMVFVYAKNAINAIWRLTLRRMFSRLLKLIFLYNIVAFCRRYINMHNTFVRNFWKVMTMCIWRVLRLHWTWVYLGIVLSRYSIWHAHIECVNGKTRGKFILYRTDVFDTIYLSFNNTVFWTCCYHMYPAGDKLRICLNRERWKSALLGTRAGWAGLKFD